MNTPWNRPELFYKKTCWCTHARRPNSPVINTLKGVLTAWFICNQKVFSNLFCACSTYTKKLTPRCIHHKEVNTPSCIHPHGVNIPHSIHDWGYETPQCIHHRKSFWTQGSPFTEHMIIGSIILKIPVRYFDYLGTCDLCLKKVPYPRSSNGLSGVFITRNELFHEYSKTIRNRFWTCLLRPGEVVVLWKKNQRRKISWHCPFKYAPNLSSICFHLDTYWDFHKYKYKNSFGFPQFYMYSQINTEKRTVQYTYITVLWICEYMSYFLWVGPVKCKKRFMTKNLLQTWKSCSTFLSICLSLISGKCIFAHCI
jgi:hypothetical protein